MLRSAPPTLKGAYGTSTGESKENCSPATAALSLYSHSIVPGGFDV
jgi:hypothetical protein